MPIPVSAPVSAPSAAPVPIPAPQRKAADDPRGSPKYPQQGSPKRQGYPPERPQYHDQGPSRSSYQQQQQQQQQRQVGRRTYPIIELYQSLIPPRADVLEREELFKRLQKIAHEVWPEAALHQYGSSANNLCLGKADMVRNSIMFFFFSVIDVCL